MEEYDDLAAGPDKDGSLNLSHNTWKALPPELSDFSNRLLHLHMSNNQLTSIPESIGALIMLRTLDISLNRIENIDGQIGKCIRLRKLNVSKNRVGNLPVDIGNCILMEELIASDNLLTSLPREMLRMFVISVIDVRNNKLHALPTELSRMPTITELLCDGNPLLGSVPENMRGDTNLVLACLDMQQKFKDVLNPLEAQHTELRARSDELRYDLTQASGRIQQLEKDVSTLKWERPDQYLQWKAQLQAHIRRVFDRMIQLLQIFKREFWKWWERRKTYPIY